MNVQANIHYDDGEDAMKTQFTPAPWQINKTETGCTIFRSDGHLRSNVAVLYDSALCPEHGSLLDNARLIAAAPDLLGACQSALRALLDNTCPGPMDADAIAGLRAAIAKAQS